VGLKLFWCNVTTEGGQEIFGRRRKGLRKKDRFFL